ncbi:MAG: NADH-quinone oxidoreductase subunit J, partial [Armatimonadia bacterium]
MNATDWLEQLGFLLVALFTLGSALGVILARRVLHAALWLLPTLVGVAGVFGLLGAHLLFAMQVIVYVG